MKVCLVNMPISAIQRPSLGLSLLASILKQAGIGAKVLYPHVWFAEYFNYDFYDSLQYTRPEDALIDWLFSATAFPGFEGDLDLLLDRAYARTPRLKRVERALLREEMLRHREKIPEFIDWVAREVLRQEPDIVGCTSVFQQHVASLALLRRIRELDESIVTMIGGANCETIMGKTAHESFPWLDFVVSGEADGLIVDLCHSIDRHGRDVDPLFLPTGVFGPAHRKFGYPVSDKSYDGLPRATAPSLETIPPPDYDDYFKELRRSLYGSRIIPGILFETSRGCWWGERKQCTFCGLNGEGMGYRSKPAERVLDEIRYLADRYGTRYLEAVDNILELKYFNTLLPELAQMDDKYSIFFETKANLKRHQVEQLAQAGVHWIQPGIESLHSGVLRLMDKGVSAWQNIQTLKYCRQYGVSVSWTIIGCFPGEQDGWYHEMAEIIPLLQHLQAGGVIALRYDRYSPYHMNSQRFGITLVPPASYAQVYPLPPDKLADLAYFFEEAEVGDYTPKLLATPVAGRPGLQAVREAMVTWRKTWTTVELAAQDEGDALLVRDTRTCAVASEHTLRGLSRQALEACDDAPTRRRLYETLDGTHETIDATLAQLQHDKLVVEIDGRLVSLVLNVPVTPMQDRQVLLGKILPMPAARAPQPVDTRPGEPQPA